MSTGVGTRGGRYGALLLVAVFLALASGAWAAASHGTRTTTMRASWYGKEQQNHLTSDGRRFDMYAFTAAHRTLPLGTILLVGNPQNGKQVRVTVTDRGPYIRGRDLDLSYAAARDLGLLRVGVASLTVTQVGHDPVYDRRPARPVAKN
jgi:rare lipoprotein A